MKIRLRYSRHGRIRFISHRDTARLFERAFRRLRLPLTYSEGFSPRPKISFGLALTVGHESEAEYLDIDLVTAIDVEVLPSQLNDVLPDGLVVAAAAPLEPGATSLQQVITCCRWTIEVLGGSIEAVNAAVSGLLAAAECPVERERKAKTTVVDVRPAILEIEVMGPTDDGVQLAVVLATESLSIRPSEFVRILGSDFREGRVCRTHQWTNAGGERIEPIPRPGRANGSALSAELALAGTARPAKAQAS